MCSFSRLLQNEYAPGIPDEGRDYLERIATSAERLDRLIQDVLSYSRISRAELPLESVDPEKLAHETLRSYSHLQQSGATIFVQAGMPRVAANGAALTQCLANLLSNAIKFVPPGVQPEVRVSAEERDGWVRLLVQDNGIGISPEGQGRIFQMFQRLNPSTEFEGTGIGLTIVRKAVERMGGRVGVESEPGQGSRFWLELRRAD
jgi:signal transduction histidine kinase